MFGELISYKGHWASLLQSQHPSLQGDCQISRKNCLRYTSRTGGQQSVSVDATVMGRHGRHQKQKHIPQDCAKHWPCRTYSMQLQFSAKGTRRTRRVWTWWSKHWQEILIPTWTMHKALPWETIIGVDPFFTCLKAPMSSRLMAKWRS